jgi:hypothetical protein
MHLSRQALGPTACCTMVLDPFQTLFEARFYAPVQTGVRAHSLLYNGTGPLSRGQQPGRAVDYQAHQTPKKEKLELCLLGHVRWSPHMLSQVFSCPRTETTNTEV